MPIYEYRCKKCLIIWEKYKDKIPKKVASTIKCISCGKKAEKMISTCSINVVGTLHKVSKSDVDRAYKEMIDDSKERLKLENAVNPYAKYTMDVKTQVDNGLARRRSDREQSNANKVYRKYTEEAYKRINKKL